LPEILEAMTFERLGLPGALRVADDDAKTVRLVADMRARGWQGPPLVVDGENALTGSHRLAAVRELLENDVQIRVQLVEITEVCKRFGVDWQVHLLDYGHLGRNAYFEGVRGLPRVLPPEVVKYLGLDLH
jgi:hypothetical protein